MTFHVKHRGDRTLVSKRVPIRAIRTNFSYGFMNAGLSDEDIEDGIAQCKKQISQDIRRTLVAKGVEPMRNSNGNH